MVRRWRLIGYFPILYNPLTPRRAQESEGYAKLVTALNRFGKDAITEESVSSEITAVQSLIGYFDLDPNRVLDLLLDWYARLSPRQGESF
jgi:hypothetical protein